MKLTQLTLHRFRDVAPTTLAFGPAFNLVLGENGTGRTTLLELLTHVLGGDFSALLSEPFSVEYALQLEGLSVQVAVRNGVPPGAPASPGAAAGAEAQEAPGAEATAPSALLRRASPGGPAEGPAMEVHLHLEAPASHLVLRASNAGVAWEVDGQPAYQQSMDWSLLDRSVWVVLLLTAHRLGPSLRERLRTLLQRVFLLGPTCFDPSLGAFEALGHLRFGLEARGGELSALNLMALPTWLSAWLRERVERGPVTDAFELSHTEVAHGFLARFVALAGLSAGSLRVEVLSQQPGEEGGGRLELGHFAFRFTRPDGSSVTGEQLGFGQKRLLSLLWTQDVHTDFLVADEPASGLHPRWVEAFLHGLGERQAFFTSQNPLLLEHLPRGPAGEVRRALVLCRVHSRTGPASARRVWANPTSEEAERLVRAREAGATPLPTLLQRQGLW